MTPHASAHNLLTTRGDCPQEEDEMSTQTQPFTLQPGAGNECP